MVHPIRFTVNHLNDEVNIAAEKLSRSPLPEATPKVLEIVPLAGELEHDCDAADESYSDREELIEESIPEDNCAH